MEKLVKYFIATAEKYYKFKDLLEHKKRSFAGINLFPSEIHTLVYIQAHIDDNFTELSKGLGLTKGAFTSVVNKLLKKSLLLKFNKGENRKNIYFDVTAMGEKCCLEHKAYHDAMKIDISDEAIDFFRDNQAVLMQALGYANQLLNGLTKEVMKND